MTSGHVSSWYAASANAHAGYPRLQGELETDVAIVGAGFTGLNAAIELRRLGVGVAVLEARRVGWGCSGRNGGQMISGIASFDRLVRALGPEHAVRAWRLGVEGLDVIRERIRHFDIDCDLRPGVFMAACNQRQLTDLRGFIARERQLGYPHALEFIEHGQVSGVVATQAYAGGVLDAGSGHLHPLNLCLGEAAGAERLGVHLFEDSPVLRIDRGPRPRVVTSAGVVVARHVIVAANAYLDGLVPELSGYVLPAGSYLIATEPLKEDVARNLFPLDSAVCDCNVLLDYYRLSSDRRLIFGGRCNHTGRVPRDIAAALLPRLLKVFPSLRGVRVDYQWGGNVAVSLRRIPQMGRLDGNIWYAQGYSGHGLVATHVFGRLLAEAITRGAELFDLLSRVRHWWLPGGRWFASPALAAGMTWYRLRDRL